MVVKKYKPRTPGQRFKTGNTFAEITKFEPEKSLLDTKKKSGGRNSRGVITVRHIGGGNKQMYRKIDFKRNDKDGIPAKVVGIEYDPNRTAFIALLSYVDGEKRYILAPIGLKVGDIVFSGSNSEIKAGNCMMLESMPVGTEVHAVEFEPNKGAQIARSAGQSVRLIAKEGKYATLRMPSGEMRKVLLQCRATIGKVGNEGHELITIGKAGRKRHMGIKPTVRGSAMNPVDHPHGGGEGKAPIGGPSPRTPWGKKALGKKTRNKKQPSSRLIIKRKNDHKGRK